MIVRIFSILSLAMAGCAAAYAIGRHKRQFEKQQHKEDLCTWEDDGGNLAPSGAAAMQRRAKAA